MATQAQLGVPALDDNMELATSPFETVDDFDIDFDHMDNADIPSTADNQLDHMAEGGDFIDDVMQADEGEEFLEDENMGDAQETDQDQHENDFDMDETRLNDENYIDPQDDDILYDEDEEAATAEEKAGKGDVEHVAQDDETPDVPALDPEAQTTQPDLLDLPEETSHPDDAGTVTTTSADPQLADAAEDTGEKEQTSTQEAHTTTEDVEVQKAAAPTDSVNLAGTSQQEPVQIPAADDQAPSENDNETAPAQVAQDPTEYAQGDESLVEDSAVQEALHAIRVDWAGKAFPLFPSSDGDASQSFVSDSSLAYESLSKLLAECHHVIKPELDRAFEDELVLDIDVLGLHICEDSRYAEQLSLAHIVEVYLLLKRNESDEAIAPLPCRITSRTCLRSQYDYLHDAGKQRRTFSSIVTETDPNSPLVQVEEREVLEETEYPSAEEPLTQQDVAENAEGPAPATTIEGDAEAAEEPIVDEQQVTESTQAGHNEPAEPAVVDSGETRGTQIQHSSPAQKPQEGVEGQDDFTEEDLFEGLGEDEEAEHVDDHVEQDPTGEAEGSTSSHTVEDESKLDEDNLEAAETYEPLNEDDERSALQPTADGANTAVTEQLIDDDNEDYFYNSDDELLNAQAPDTEGTVSQDHLAVEADVEADATANDHEDDLETNGVQGEDLATDPITPQKAVPAKRKALEEEDDLLDFGFDTPEPKRSRPS